MKEDAEEQLHSIIQSFLCAPLRVFFSTNLHGKYNLRQGLR